MFVLAASTVVAGAAAALSSNQRQVESSYWVRHTLEVLDALEGVRSALRETEMAQRNYLLTGDPVSLETFRTSVTTVMPALNQLVVLTRDNELEHTRAVELGPVFEPQLKRLQHNVELFQSGDHEAALTALQQSDFQRPLDAGRLQIVAMRNEELGLLHTRTDEINHSIGQARVVSSGAALVLLALIGLAWVTVMRDRRAVQRALEDREQFLASASHEFKTPIATLLLQGEVLRRRMLKLGLEPDERLERAVEAIDRQGRRLARLVNGVLDVVQFTVAPTPSELGEFDVEALVKEVASELEYERQPTGSSLQVIGGPLRMRSEQTRLKQLLGSLLSNAYRFGEGKPVEVQLGRQGEQVQMKVIDNGIGISESDQARIFNRFTRVADGKNYWGMGMGLWLAQQIAAALGGKISVESHLGHGACFTVSLPG
jgi:signal transduction histidine kinase